MADGLDQVIEQHSEHRVGVAEQRVTPSGDIAGPLVDPDLFDRVRCLDAATEVLGLSAIPSPPLPQLLGEAEGQARGGLCGWQADGHEALPPPVVVDDVGVQIDAVLTAVQISLERLRLRPTECRVEPCIGPVDHAEVRHRHRRNYTTGLERVHEPARLSVLDSRPPRRVGWRWCCLGQGGREPEMFDAIVVGSGFGGAVVACRAAERGLRVLVLERGRRWSRADYPRGPKDDWLFDNQRPHRSNGWLDLRVFKQMTVPLAAGVGGGSLAYSSVAVEAPPTIFSHGWPADLTYDELKPYYDVVADVMNLQAIPDGQLTQRFKLAREPAHASGRRGPLLEAAPGGHVF